MTGRGAGFYHPAKTARLTAGLRRARGIAALLSAADREGPASNIGQAIGSDRVTPPQAKDPAAGPFTARSPNLEVNQRVLPLLSAF